MPVIGFLRRHSPDACAMVDRVPPGPEGTGYVDGRNVAIEYRWAENSDDRLPTLAAELVRPPGGRDRSATPLSALAAKAATTTVPIVFAIGSDPVTTAL